MRFPSIPRAGQEALRLVLLITGAAWLSSPLWTRNWIGGGDALWYRNQIADAVTQLRAGVFPVLVGQTAYAFNGGIHPIRTAPYCQYLAGLVDVLTGRSLGFHTLLHLTVVVSLLAGALSAYAALTWLAPERRGRAALLAWAYVSAPGVLGLVYAQELYMSAMAVPWVPVALAASMQLYREPGYRAPAWLGVSLGALWWAHSPIALWTTLGVALLWLGRLAQVVRRPQDRGPFWRGDLITGALAGVLGGYPVVSVLLLRTPGEKVVPRALDREALWREITGAFPAIVSPLDFGRPLLTYIQPGYLILASLAGAAAAAFLRPELRRTGLPLLLGYAAFCLCLILPVPLVSHGLWFHLPETWVDMTNIWPMQRFCLILAALAVVAAQTAWAREAVPRKWTELLVVGALIWSAYQAGQVRSLAASRTHSDDETRRIDAEENVNLSEIGYQQLPRRPGYFIHGVMDPRMELRLLEPAGGAFLTGNKAAVEQSSRAPWIDLAVAPTANPGLFEIGPPLTLRPGIQYLVTFDFARPELHGVLRLNGARLQRVYLLPQAGEARGFGTAPGQEKSLALWSSRAGEPETVQMDFIPESSDGAHVALPKTLGRARLSPVEPGQLPAQIESLLPLRIVVRSPAAAQLETPRVFIPGWTAKVNGVSAPVIRTAENLVAVPVPAGTSRVEVNYRGPLLLRAVFWICFAGWVAALGLGARALVRAFRRT